MEATGSGTDTVGADHARLIALLEEPIAFAELLIDRPYFIALRETDVPEIVSREGLALLDYTPPDSAPKAVQAAWGEALGATRERLIESIRRNERRVLDAGGTSDTSLGLSRSLDGSAVSAAAPGMLYRTVVDMRDQVEMFLAISQYIDEHKLFNINSDRDGIVSGFGECPSEKKGPFNTVWFGRCEYKVAVRPSYQREDVNRIDVVVTYLQRRTPRGAWRGVSNSTLVEERALELFEEIRNGVFEGGAR